MIVFRENNLKKKLKEKVEKQGKKLNFFEQKFQVQDKYNKQCTLYSDTNINNETKKNVSNSLKRPHESYAIQ